MSTVKNKICPVCKRKFLPNSNNQTYCQKQCAKEARKTNRKRIVKECAHCGKSFKCELGIQKFCSSACYGKTLETPSLLQKTCTECGKEFLSKDPRKCCSELCRKASHSKKTQKVKVEKTCKFCGKKFKVHQSMQKRTKYCCRKCKDAGLRVQTEITCAQCQKVISTQKWYADNGKKYCSKVCSNNALMNKIECTCPTCGTIFERTPSQIEGKNNVYCSVTCSQIGSKKEWADDFLKERWPSSTKYGHWWRLLAARIRKRDGYTCRLCGITRKNPALHVHHIKPISQFNRFELNDANKPSNLITLCNSCHRKAESNPSLIVLSRSTRQQ